MEVRNINDNRIVCDCLKCKKMHVIQVADTIRSSKNKYEFIEPLVCTCGETHTECIVMNLFGGKTLVDTRTVELRCPKCKSTQLTAGNKGFSLGKAAVGGILVGGVGLLGGLVGSKKIIVGCMSCGHKWEAGK